MTLFRLDASIRTDGSVTRAVADAVEAGLRAAAPGTPVVRRDVGLRPLPATAWSAAVLAPEEGATDRHRDATALAGRLADELLDADVFLFAVPLYNYGVDQHFKTWADLVLTDARIQQERALAGRPAVLVTARGGGYGPGTPREGWDHATPWMRRILGDVMGLDLQTSETELTLAGAVPAMEALRGLAAQSLADAHASAAGHGTWLARALRVAA